MRTKPNLKPDSEQPNLPFLDPGAVPELDEEISSLDDILREAANLPGMDELMASLPSLDDILKEFTGPEYERKARELLHCDPAADRASLLSPDEKDVSRLLGCYAARKPPRRCHRRRKANS